MEVARPRKGEVLVKPTQGQFETFSVRSRGNLGKEAVSRSVDPSPGSRSMAALDAASYVQLISLIPPLALKVY